MATSIQRPYKVRTSWGDSKHQFGSYAYIDTAKRACLSIYSTLDPEELTFKVFKDGVCIYNPKEDQDLPKPLFENTNGGKEMLQEISQPPTTHHYNVIDGKSVEKPSVKHLSLFQRIKNIFRKK